ncbi:APC family permease [Streptantibioticus rubrisoli]|uniref:APC family permease n=1 Tax=Streptantibioticus rubrisoli TaxID=1387313 RepID=A0ABT1P9H1_9ACTN|nr:APC family permease [Streptantibioticus rubrisoli]MCQ4042017.1 APC family permease [Streptantibioticus rubrisoli]
MAADALGGQGAEGEADRKVGEHERDRLTVPQGLAALSLDALASVAYGPEAIVVVLAAAGSRGLGLTLPVTVAIVVLLAALTFSYRQVIAAFPDGGGAYAVAGRHLGRRVSLVAAASLIIDYVLNVAVSVSAGVAALTSAFPSLYGDRVWLCVIVLALITGVNLYGVAESAKVMIAPTVVFVAAIFAVIVVGLLRAHPATAPSHATGSAVSTVGVLLLLRAFASGCSALTGVEAIANAVPTFRSPRVRRAQRTELALGGLLGLMLLGLSLLISRFHVAPSSTKTVLAQLADASFGHNVGFYVVQFATMVLLALAANTSFGGMPVLTSLLARDNNLPHVFWLRADRQVYRHGVMVLAAAALVLLIGAQGDTQALVPFFAIGVFIGFTISQLGMVRHWRIERGVGWQGRALLNGLGAVLTAVALVIELVAKFGEGGWLVFLVVAVLVGLFEAVNRAYRRIGQGLHLGEVPGPPEERRSLVIVPVGAVNLLTREAISAALSLGDEVRAVTVVHPDDQSGAQRLREAWSAWHPQVPLIVLTSRTRSLTRPIVDHLRAVGAEEAHDRLVVLIPEMHLPRPWQRLLQNQRGAVLDRAIRRYTDAVICRLRFRIDIPR